MGRGRLYAGCPFVIRPTAGHRHVGEVVQHNPESRKPRGACSHAWQPLLAHEQVQREVVGGELLQRPEVHRVVHRRLAQPDAVEQIMARIPVQVRFETGVRRFQVSHQAQQEGIGLGQVQDPLVVLHPCTGFHHDRARDAFGLRFPFEIIRHDTPVEKLVIAVRPRYALRPGRIVEMGMGVDDQVAFLSETLRQLSKKSAFDAENPNCCSISRTAISVTKSSSSVSGNSTPAVQSRRNTMLYP